MTDNTYHCDGQFPTMGHMLQCHKCGRKILVEIALCGVNHNLSVTATCGKCLQVNDEFKQSYPVAVEKIEKWLDASVQDL